MNYICIKRVSDFKIIIDSPVYIPKNQDLENFENTWAIALDSNIKKISIQDLTEFIDSLVQKKQQQLLQSNIAYPATFYLWFDEMAGQLRFNIILNYVKELPFGCKIEIINSAQPILEKFFSSKYLAGIPKNEIQPCKDDEDEEDYTLKVWVMYLNLR